MQSQLGFEFGEVGQSGTFPQHALMKLRAGLLHADFERGVRFGVERHRLAVLDVVLPHPTAMRLADVDLDAGVLFSPSPDELLHFLEASNVFVVRSVLADFEPAVRVNENRR